MQRNLYAKGLVTEKLENGDYRTTVNSDFHLFKYLSLEKEHHIKNILDNKVSLTTAMSFNDLLDMYPYIDFGKVDFYLNRLRHTLYFENSYKRFKVEMKKDISREEFFPMFKEFMLKVQEQMLLNQNYTYCTSTRFDSPVMWGLYGGGFYGVVLEFNAIELRNSIEKQMLDEMSESKNPFDVSILNAVNERNKDNLYCSLQAIKYIRKREDVTDYLVKSFKILNDETKYFSDEKSMNRFLQRIEEEIDNDLFFKKTSFTKLSKWNFEDEWRITLRNFHLLKHIFYGKKPKNYKLFNAKPVSITVGSQITNKNFDVIYKHCEKNSIQLYQASPDYSLISGKIKRIKIL